MRSRQQLSLPFAEPAPSSVTSATPTSTSPQVSQTRSLVAAITEQVPGARVRIVDSRTRLLHWTEQNGVRTFHVHKLFLDVDEAERQAIARYLATGDPVSGSVIDAVVRRQRFLLDFMAAPLAPGAHLGRTHDLATIRDAMIDAYFDQRLEAEITWAKASTSRRRKRRHITYGAYDFRERRITIHPALDEPEVPTLVVARIVHHELLHAKHGEEIDAAGRRILHSPAFRQDEALFAGAKDADAWLDANLERLLCWHPRR
jgi:hypothetical protein